MKSFWLLTSGRFQRSEWMATLMAMLIRYGQVLIFLLAMISLFFWYNAMQSVVADFLNEPRVPAVPE